MKIYYFAGILFFGICLNATFGAAQAPAPDKAVIKQIVQEVLDENPDMLIDALERLRDKSQAGDKTGGNKILSELRKELERDPGTFIAGNPNGDVTVVEFFDYRCGYCKRASPVVQQLLQKDGRIRLALKEFPILGPDSLVASRAAIASIEQGKYEPFHVALMAASGSLSEERIMRIASDVGLDTVKLRKDMESPVVKKIIKRNHEIARKLDISGTPSFIIGDTLAPGFVDIEQMQWLVESAREECQTC